MHNSVRRVISGLLYTLVFVILIFSITLFVPAMKRSAALEKERNELNEELSRKRGEEMRLSKEVHALEHDPVAAEKVAREKFNLCRDGEIVIRYE